jgi:predicted negative regulator of RcsB-dependent stress response
MSTTEPKKDFIATLSITLNNFFQKTRVFLVAFLLIVIAGLIVVTVYMVIQNGIAAKGMSAAGTIIEKFNDYQSNQEGTDKPALKTEIIAQAEKTALTYKGTYAAQKSLSILAFFQNEDGQKEAAADFYLKAASEMKNSYLSPISLFQAASLYEDMGNNAKALEILGSFMADFEKSSSLTPRVLCSIGRILEKDNKIKKAAGTETGWDSAQICYETLEKNYPDTTWASIAINRLIDLELKGQISLE